MNSGRGFTLTELAVVLVIVSLLTGGLMMTLGAQIDQRYRSETLQQLQEAREALVGYAASHSAADGKPYLPCPDTDGDGLENRTGATCTNAEGDLPWGDLGLARQDAWSNRFRYRVEQSFARQDTGFLLTTAGNLRVCDQAACTTTIATGLPAVIASHGRNGLGATNSAGGTNTAPSGADELENTDGDDDYVSHTPATADAAGGEFDDLAAWISRPLLVSRMISAGRLP